MVLVSHHTGSPLGYSPTNEAIKTRENRKGESPPGRKIASEWLAHTALSDKPGSVCG